MNFNMEGTNMKKLLFLFIATMALASCVKEDPTTVNNLADGEQVVTITASAPSTKTQLVGGTKVHWSPEDKIKMCFIAMQHYKDNITGPSAEFKSLNESISESAAFQGSIEINKTGVHGFVFYPSSFYFYSYSKGGSYQESREITYNLPANQIAKENSFPENMNPSWAYVSSDEVNQNINNKKPINVSFTNLASLIKISLPNLEYNIKEIQIKSDNTALVGEYNFELEYSQNSKKLLATTLKSSSNIVTLTKEDQSNLTLGTSYYAIIWPSTHNSLTFTFIDQEGKTCVKTLNKSVTCEVGKILEVNIKSLEFKEPEPELTLNTNQLNFSAEGGNATFSFNTNKNWTISASNALWMEVTPKFGEASKDAISINVKCYENPTYQPRTNKITISAGGLTKEININQEAAKKVISLNVSSDRIQVPGQGGTVSFTVTCNDNWTISDIPDWLTFSKTSGTESSSAITVNIIAKQNFFYNSKNKSVAIKAGDVVKYISISQSGVVSYSIGDNVSKAGDLEDGQPYIIENNRHNGLYWKWQSSNLKYCKWNSTGIQTIMCTFIYHRDDTKGKSGDNNYKSWSTGIWEAAASESQYLNSNWKFDSVSNAKYIANSNCYGTETGNDFDMCEVGKTTSVCYTDTSSENGGNYYWGDTSQTNRKWKVYKAVPQY